MQELLAVLPDWLGVYLLTVNVAAFAVYGADKLRARQGCWRVPEKTLFLLAIVGGGVGALLGMWCFHHKTRHWYFRYGIPVMGVTAVGKQMARDSRYFALASRVCAENGASIVKTYYCDGFEKVAAACPVPVVIAGGKKLPEKEALELCYNAVNDGAAGVDMGRNVFQSENPAAMIQAVHAVVHEGLTPEQGFEMFKDLQ